MPRFSEGDRVRLGALRGGVVVCHDGQLRVRFGDAQKLLWLDHCVPDEGPDGRIFPSTWDHCPTCSNPTTGFFCINCDRRFARAIAQPQPPLPVHLAGPIRRSPRRYEQRCTRCGALLVSALGETRPGPPPGTFPEGSLVQRTYMGLGAPIEPVTEPTCTPVREAVSA